jgi:hypothetical protein
MFRAKKTFFRLRYHLGKVELARRRKTPRDDSAPPFGQGVDPDLRGDGDRFKLFKRREKVRLEMESFKFNFHVVYSSHLLSPDEGREVFSFDP